MSSSNPVFTKPPTSRGQTTDKPPGRTRTSNVPSSRTRTTNNAGSRARTSSNSAKPKCGICGLIWTACKCDASLATESVSTVLKFVQNTAPTSSIHHLTHLHVLVWLPYRRWMARMAGDTFSGDCFPGFEGWRSAWVRPIQDTPCKVAGFIEVLLPIDLVFHDGTAMRAYCARNGQLVGIVGVNGPDRGVHRDVPYPPHQVDILDVSKALTWDEIESGRRGVVHGSTRSRNNLRKVSSIVQKVGEQYQVRLIPHSNYDEKVTVMLNENIVTSYAPQLVEEFEFRHKNYLTKAVVNASKPFIESLFMRAITNDKAAREISTLVTTSMSSKRYNQISQDLDSALDILSQGFVSQQ